jgi:hypothetical protein
MKNDIMSFSGKWIEWEHMMLSKISQSQRDKYYDFSYLQKIELNDNMIICHEHKREGMSRMGGGEEENDVSDYDQSTLKII